MSNSSLVKKIEKKIENLYLLDPKIEKGLLDNLHEFPEKVLQDIVVTLEEAEKKQQEIITKLNLKNKNFNKELKDFLDKQCKYAADVFTENERLEADKLLND